MSCKGLCPRDPWVVFANGWPESPDEDCPVCLVKDKFYEHYDAWKTDTKNCSSSDRIIKTKHYQDIIGLGEPAIPWILKTLEYNSSESFNYALKEITGNCFNTAKEWIEWGRKEGYSF